MREEKINCKLSKYNREGNDVVSVEESNDGHNP